MAKHENLPFPIGSTWFDGQTPDSTKGGELEGRVFEIEDLDYSVSGVKPARSNRLRTVMIVRNVGAAALLPKYMVSMKSDGLNFLGQVDGMSTVTADWPCFPLDEFLPSAGLAVNDLGYVVIEGPAMCKTDLAGGANNVINVGGALVSLTAATSGATTAGRVKPQDLTGATAVLGAELQGLVGWALSAKTTANTNADVLVSIGRY